MQTYVGLLTEMTTTSISGSSSKEQAVQVKRDSTWRKIEEKYSRVLVTRLNPDSLTTKSTRGPRAVVDTPYSAIRTEDYKVRKVK